MHDWVRTGSWPSARTTVRRFGGSVLPGVPVSLLALGVAGLLAADLAALATGRVPGGPVALLVTALVAAGLAGYAGLVVVEVGGNGAGGGGRRPGPPPRLPRRTHPLGGAHRGDRAGRAAHRAGHPGRGADPRRLHSGRPARRRRPPVVGDADRTEPGAAVTADRPGRAAEPGRPPP
ncbi:hypothetical protein NKG94_10900 [Micromonospora sp. M12]